MSTSASADALFPSNPALGVFTGESEVLPLTVELISFPAWPLCCPPGPSVVGPHFCHLWINNSCSPNHFPIDWYFAACLFMRRERRALFVSWFNLMLLFFFIIQTLQARISVDGNMITDEPRPCTIQVQKHPKAKYHINEQRYKKNYIFEWMFCLKMRLSRALVWLCEQRPLCALQTFMFSVFCYLLIAYVYEYTLKGQSWHPSSYCVVFLASCRTLCTKDFLFWD